MPFHESFVTSNFVNIFFFAGTMKPSWFLLSCFSRHIFHNSLLLVSLHWLLVPLVNLSCLLLRWKYQKHRLFVFVTERKCLIVFCKIKAPINNASMAKTNYETVAETKIFHLSTNEFFPRSLKLGRNHQL